LIGIKPEVIQCTEANRVGVLIGRKSFRAPSNGFGVFGHIPRGAAKASVSLGAIMWPTRMLRRGMKSDVAWAAKEKGDTERLNGAIEIHVKDGIIIVEYPAIVRYLVTDKENPVVPWIGLNLGHGCACRFPSLEGRLHSHCATNR